MTRRTERLPPPSPPAPDAPVLHFGRYAGWPLELVPAWYLKWLVAVEQRPPLKQCNPRAYREIVRLVIVHLTNELTNEEPTPSAASCASAGATETAAVG
ncbi:MAG TPA: hypothetical protein VMT66_16890 [Steroidobacteraceae bacterium]|nr:hypothetical protein [Steroidobacteraceae bacterium]